MFYERLYVKKSYTQISKINDLVGDVAISNWDESEGFSENHTFWFMMKNHESKGFSKNEIYIQYHFICNFVNDKFHLIIWVCFVYFWYVSKLCGSQDRTQVYENIVKSEFAISRKKFTLYLKIMVKFAHQYIFF